MMSLHEGHKYSDQLDLVEKVNADYLALLDSAEYNCGRRVLKLKERLRKGEILKVLKMALKTSERIFVDRSRASESVFQSSITNRWLPEGDECCVVYTCITQGYDDYKPPLIYPTGVRYCMVSDMSIPVDRDIEFFDIEQFGQGDKSFNFNRYMKLHPFELFQNCRYSLYVDGNVRIVSDIRPLFQAAKEAKTGIAMHSHCSRRCLYEEAAACIKVGKGNADAIRKQTERYKMLGFPEGFGLFEANVIAVDHENEVARTIFERWWNEFVRSGSERDQLSLPFVLWSSGFDCDDVGCLGTNVKLNPKFRVENHQGI